jgi:hypothetical protein
VSPAIAVRLGKLFRWCRSLGPYAARIRYLERHPTFNAIVQRSRILKWSFPRIYLICFGRFFGRQFSFSSTRTPFLPGLSARYFLISDVCPGSFPAEAEQVKDRKFALASAGMRGPRGPHSSLEVNNEIKKNPQP